MTSVEGIELPPAWDAECYGDFIVITRPTVGHVTINLKRRGFRAGIVETGPLTSHGTYVGRGWRKALVTAAIRWLDSL